jgi:small-conductance mechanosensitive channel
MASSRYSRHEENPTARRAQKRRALRQIITLGAILAAVLAATTYLLQPLFPDGYVLYFHVAEVAVVGFFIIQILSNISYSLALVHSEQTAKSMKSLVRIAGAIVVIAFIISYLSQDPVIAASISTIAGLVVGFSSMNIISNVIAGMYLAIARPFRIDDRIKVFGEVGVVHDIGMLYTRFALENGDEMLATNSSLVTTSVVLKKETEKGETSQKDAAAAGAYRTYIMPPETSVTNSTLASSFVLATMALSQRLSMPWLQIVTFL